MLKNFLKTATDTVRETSLKISENTSEKFKDVKNSQISDITLKKLKGMNESVLKNWVKDEDTPDERSFWDKMSESAKKIGEDLAVTGIKSWLAMTDPNTNIQHKAILGAALAYFVLPVDMIPDFVAGVGYTDDAAALALAINKATDSITEEHSIQAKQKWDSFWDSEIEANKPTLEQ
jgi:uncharacterized membrane protein YkvA (DUF1232 family)